MKDIVGEFGKSILKHLEWPQKKLQETDRT